VKEGFRFWRFTRGLPRRPSEAQPVAAAASSHSSSSTHISSSSSSSSSVTSSSTSASGSMKAAAAETSSTSNSDEPELNEYDDSTVVRLDSDVSNGFGTEEVADIDDKWL
jgi:hypothetical protein